MKRPAPMRMRLAARSIGEDLSACRRIRNLTAQQVADKADVSRATISRLENGDPSVSLCTFLGVCNALGILDEVTKAVDPYESDCGRLRAGQSLPQRIRR